MGELMQGHPCRYSSDRGNAPEHSLSREEEMHYMKLVLLTIVLLSIMLFALLYPTPMVNAQPRSDLAITWFTTSDGAFAALQNDQIDLIQWDYWTTTQKAAAEADPNLQIAARAETGMFEFDINNNKTIKDYPTSTNPCYFKGFRQVIAHLTDKEYYINSILQDMGIRIDAPVGYASTTGWVDLSVVTYDANGNGVIEPSEDNYPYPYSVDAAVDLLAAMGFNDTNGNGYLNYPDNASAWGTAAGIETTSMPLKICIRSDNSYRLGVGRHLYRQFEGNPDLAGDSVLATSARWAANGRVGGDFDTTDEPNIRPPIILSPIVMGDRNYHIYTGGWSMGRFPTYLFNLFHSMFWYPYGTNYVSGAPGTHPNEDMILEKMYYASSVEDSKNASRWYTHEHVINCINIPLWSYVHYVTWRKELAGVTNMKGYGIVNDYTFLSAYRANNPSAPIRLGATMQWDKLNILYSQWYAEYALLDRVYTGLVAANPYDTSSDIPWAAQDWEVGTWFDDSVEKTAVTYYLRKDLGCAAPATGAYAGRFNATDFEFTLWYAYAYDDSWQWSSFMDIHHTEITDDYTIKVYFDDLSMWFQYAPTYPLLGPHTMLRDLLCQVASATFTAPTIGGEIQFGGGASSTDGVVQVINATADGSPIIENANYTIRAGYYEGCHNVFVNNALTPGANVTIYYYKGVSGGADGTYLGGNLGYGWTDTMYSYGYYYPVLITSTTASLKKNPYFFLETPVLGEIDWRWNYQGTTKPRSGNFQINILDVVKCTSVYSTRGDGPYDPMYLPGADLDASDLCHIGILDLVTVTGHYAETFGTPP
jgi:hypothetical protein